MWEVLAYNVIRPTSVTANEEGYCIMQCPNGPIVGQVWAVTQVTVIANDAAPEAGELYVPCLLYDQDPLEGFPVPCGGTRAGGFDVADFASPLIITGGSALYIFWEGLPPGTVCKARVQYELRVKAGKAAATPVAH